jgi:hypothetical protein
MAEAIKVRVTKQGANGPRGLDGRGVVAQSFTIPATVTDSPTFQVENDFFVNGETQSVTINGIFGTLTKVNNNYIFKRKAVGLETVITIGTNIFFVIDPAESENKNPLKIGSAAQNKTEN